ncbi:MAG: signal recognition particle-docking protein FtsY [Spirochaetes bacterium]|nr:MAG: signal recognition particle-docking protein FtsY [Spirochaetota bacterium]
MIKLGLKLGKKLGNIFSSKTLTEEQLLSLEEELIIADFGVDFTEEILEELKKSMNKNPDKDVKELLIEIIGNKIVPAPVMDISPVTVIIIFGVNGTGKTTSVGKLAYLLKNQGRKVLIAAADTYRDAAIDQLQIWAKKADVPVIKQTQGADPAAVVYDACDSAVSRNVDALIVDTAGRLHTKERLMEELSKIGKVIEKKLPKSKKIKLLTIDATTGQNGLVQAEQFNQYIGIDGILLTKLDTSSKGGIACSISAKLKIPIYFVGTGEKLEDLAVFNKDEYLKSLFS